jgi:hypothetical protein
MSGQVLLSVDPGIDGTGVAAFDMRRGDIGRGSALAGAAAAEALLELRLYETDSAASHETRICSLVGQLRDDVDRYRTVGSRVVIAVEAPSYTGVYGAHGKKGRSGASVGDGVAKVNRTIGGLVAGAYLLADELHVYDPDQLPRALSRVFTDVKAYRRHQVQQALAAAGRGKANLPGWGRLTELSNEDKIDACWLGFRHLAGGNITPLQASLAHGH